MLSIVLFFYFVYLTLFVLGIVGLFYNQILMALVLIGFIFFLHINKRVVLLFFDKLKIFKLKTFLYKEKMFSLLICIFLIQVVVNVIGVFAPELSFDALWYHLTLSKLYLLNHAVYHIPGGLLYYSDMPKAGELFYTVGLSFGNETLPNLIHFSFGILSSIGIFLLARKFLSPFLAFVAVIIFYSNIVVAWESTIAYIDLIRTFFELIALLGIITWSETQKRKWFYLSALSLGMAIATKVIALGSLVIFISLIIYFLRKQPLKVSLQAIAKFLLITLLVPLPWFIFAYCNTGNPFYPLFSPIFIGVNKKVFDIALINPLHFLGTFWNVFTHANDPVNPVYMIFFPALIFYFKKSNTYQKILYSYMLIALLLWYLISQVEGSRMLLPYLPALSILCASLLEQIKKESKKLFHFMLGVIIFCALITIGYRFFAEIKYIPVLLGTQSKQEFLTNHLNFSFGDFYDTDNYFAEHIKNTDRVLLYGFHNLYYVNFPFIDSSWIKKGDRFDYIAVQNGILPKQYKNWQMVYYNTKTLVTLYKPPKNICHQLCVY